MNITIRFLCSTGRRTHRQSAVSEKHNVFSLFLFLWMVMLVMMVMIMMKIGTCLTIVATAFVVDAKCITLMNNH